MQAKLNKFLFWIYGGDPEHIELDRRVFLLLTASSVVIALAGLAVNLLAGINIWSTLITASGPAVLLVIFLFIRNVKTYHVYFFPIVLLILALIAAVWFTNAGYNGNILLLLYYVLTTTYIAAKASQRIYLLIIILLFSSGLITIQYLYPQYIIPYDNLEQRFYDILFGNLIYMTMLFVVLRVLINSCNTQANSLLQKTRLLTESEEKYRLLVEEASDPVFSYTTDGHYKYVNRAFAKIVEESPERIIGKTPRDLFTIDEASARLDALQEAINTGKSHVIEVFYSKRNKYYQSTLTPIHNQSGELVSVIGVSKDITERKKTEAILEQSYRRLELFFNQSMYGYYCSSFDQPVEWNDRIDKEKVLEDIDQHQFITEINDAMLDHYKAKRENMVGRPMSAFFKHDKEAAKNSRRELFDKGHLHVETFELKDDNTPVWIEGDYKCTYDDQGRIIGTFGIQLDISERRKAEREREKLQEQLVQTQKMESIGRLAGGVAHDFNNMLQIILGNVEFALLQDINSELLRNNLREIQKSAIQSSQLTQRLLAFARKQTITPKAVNLNEVVESILKMIRRLIGEDIILEWQPGRNLWNIKIDPGQVDQILANLCVYSRDAITGVGKIIIRTENRLVSTDGEPLDAQKSSEEYVILSVSDNGCGMTQEVYSHLFEPFFTTKEIGKGTGLGLAMIYGIIQQNNGLINVISEPGKGTLFELSFPRHYLDNLPQDRVEDTPKDLKGSETILLVEDEPGILEFTNIILTTFGYSVLLAVNPSEALQISHSHTGKIHLLLTDVIMPEMNGRELARIIQLNHPEIKLMFMSGYSADVIAPHGVLDEGMSFIEKPFMLDDLLMKVRTTLDSD